MKTLRTLFTRGRTTGSRFDRYYSGVLRPGAGYPTADEARRDLRRYDIATQHYSLMR
jgi:hypothetical protein